MSDAVKKIFARNLTRYIAQSGKTQKELADMLGVAQSTFNNWCTGVRYPRMDKVEQLARYFGIKKSDLIEDKAAQEAEAPAGNGGLPRDTRELIEYVRTSVPEDKAAMALRVLRSIVEDAQ